MKSPNEHSHAHPEEPFSAPFTNNHYTAPGPPEQNEPGHSHSGKHAHTHGAIDSSIAMSERGVWAVKRSFVILFITASLQLFVVILSHSVSLLADTIHNFGDGVTAIPLWIAFRFAQRRPSKTFRYGYGRVEDLAGIFVVLIILFSAVFSGYLAIDRIFHPQHVSNLGALAIAAIIGFAGNEIVAIFRIKVGKEIDSAALIADGFHARTDGYTSLAVLLSAVGVYFGYPLADPIIGLLITVTILGIVRDSVKTIFVRILDGVEPKIVDEIYHAAAHVSGVKRLTDVRARWHGHRLIAEMSATVDSSMSVEQAHQISNEVQHQVAHHLPQVLSILVHIDPETASGNEHHSVTAHTHDSALTHTHEYL